MWTETSIFRGKEEKLEPDCSVWNIIAQQGGVVFKPSYKELGQLIVNNII